MQKLKLAGLAILSGLLMGISWPETGGLAPLFFIALLPLLYIEYTISQNNDHYGSRHVFYFSYLTFFTFNTFTTWWIWYASEGGMIMAEVLYSLFMSLTFLCFHFTKKKLGNNKGYFSLIVLWLGFEWLHFNWEFSHPWNPFGNVFANYTRLIQWYEYSGVAGGTLWVLLSNIFIFHFLKRIIILGQSFKNNFKFLIGITLLLFAPSILSLMIYHKYVEEKNPIEITIVQPNIDPYKDKFGGMTEAEQVDRILNLASKKTTLTTDYIIAPETAIPRGAVESEIENNYAIKIIRDFIKNYPKTNFIIGATTYIEYPKNANKPTLTARSNINTDGWYDVFNSALQISNNQPIQFYHKSKLVLGVEKLPYPKFFSLFEKFAINLGGTVGSYGTEKEAHNLINNNKIAPVICYESIYGEYVTNYIKKKANAIFIITNDGWWEDTPGYKQHLSYARLRAIENRRSIARSANTGISCFINQRGDIIQPTNWWKQEVIRGSINLNSKITYYTNNGDYIGRTAGFIAVLLLLWGGILKLLPKKY